MSRNKAVEAEKVFDLFLKDHEEAGRIRMQLDEDNSIRRAITVDDLRRVAEELGLDQDIPEEDLKGMIQLLSSNTGQGNQIILRSSDAHIASSV